MCDQTLRASLKILTPDTPGSYCRKLPDDARKVFADLQSDTQQQEEAVTSPFHLHLSKVNAQAFN